MTSVTIGQAYQIVLSHRCAYSCGYCEFPHTPSPQLPSKSMVLRQACIGQRQGANQVVLTSGSAIDTHSEIITAVRFLGYSNWVNYLYSLCDALLKGKKDPHGAMFPVLDVGGLSVFEFRKLRGICPVMRLMLHSADVTLQNQRAHMHARHKTPSQCLKYLESMGRVGIATVTGIRVGIGEKKSSWEDAARAVSYLHGKYGNIMLFSLIPFEPSPFSPMSNDPACSDEMLLEAVASVRNYLDKSITLGVEIGYRAHLTDEFLNLGVRDLGEFKYGDTTMLNMDCSDRVQKLKMKLSKKGITLISRREGLLQFMKARNLPANLAGTEAEEELANLLERVYLGK